MSDEKTSVEGEISEAASRERAERAIREFRRRNFGERFVNATLGTVEAKTAQRIIPFLKKPKNILVYCGSPGIGKTYLCAALVEWACSTFDYFRYWREADLLKRIRNEMEEVKGDYLETLKHLIDDQFIMLDDVGSTGLREWREEVFFDFLDTRYNSMLPTVITSNFSVAEFKQCYHPRICDRLFATENIVIEIKDAESLRSKGK